MFSALGFINDLHGCNTKNASRLNTTAGRRRDKTQRWKAASFESLESRTLLSAYLVNTLADPATLTSGTLSLRQAIVEANNNPGTDTITFQSDLAGTITLAFGQLELSATTGTTTITGPGAGVLTINGNNASRVFEIDSGVTASITGLTITGGNATGQSDGGGGILNGGTLTLSNSTLSGNAAAGNGGGLANAGSIGTVSGNATVDACSFWANTASAGAGIYAGAGTLTLTDSTVSGNSGEGIHSFEGEISIAGSTISGNSGGGIFDQGTMSITNSTISGNSGGSAGAVLVIGDLTLNDCTISANSAQSCGGIDLGLDEVTALNNTIVSGNTLTGANTPSDFVAATYTIPPNPEIFTEMATGSNNLIGAGPSGLTNGVDGNIVGVTNPLLGPLQYNGGPTQTMALLTGSPAIGAGSNTLALAANVITDQRGEPLQSPPDIGAYQISAPSMASEYQAYVNQVYHDILHRAADSAGLTYWTTQLSDGASLQSVALGLSSSLEYYNYVVTSYYEEYLGRAPDTAGLNHWANLMVQGASAESIRISILSSQEYYNDGGGTAAGYVTELYQALLGRAPDSSGESYWETVLAGPGGAAAVATGIVYSGEFYNDIISSYYEAYLHRAADSDGLASWVSTLESGVSEQVIISDFVSSVEYLALNNISIS